MKGGSAEEALARFLGSRRRARTLLGRTSLRHLAEASEPELARFMPRASAARFASAMRLSKLALSPERPPILHGAGSAHAHFYPHLAGKETERFAVIACDAALRVLATAVVAEGSPLSVQVRPADAFALAVRHRAAGVVFGHNHPSGNEEPSSDDIALTERFAAIGEALGIRVLDHLIVCGDRYRSVLPCHGRASRALESAAEPALRRLALIGERARGFARRRGGAP